MRSARSLAAILLVLAACSGDDQTSSPSTMSSSTTEGTTTTVPEFTGDPDSPFCTLVAAAEDNAVLDPFEPGLEPREVELRFRAMQLRFAEFAEAAPPELAGELADIVAALEDLDSVLAVADYDFTALAESGSDLSVFDDPRFAETAARIDAYRDQVCEP